MKAIKTFRDFLVFLNLTRFKKTGWFIATLAMAVFLVFVMEGLLS